MDRLTSRLHSLAEQKAKALVTFITAGDPNLVGTGQIMTVLEQAGADIIELGMPFSDPMADGPTIQLSSERALTAGTTLDDILGLVRQFRDTSSLPVILMGYLNPIYAYGYARFAADAVAAGVDGVLLVDMPPEESAEFIACARQTGLHVIFLLTPTSDHTRIDLVNQLGRGFVYYVTVTGVTGAREQVSTTLTGELDTIRASLSLPVMAGFGISTPDQARRVAHLADGIVVGSAIVRLFEQYQGEELREQVRRFVVSIKQAIAAP